jgi:lipopolysaccharide export system permease protein
MIGQLAGYMNRMVLTRFAVILLLVGSFAVLFDLLDVGTRVVRRLDGGIGTLAWYALWRLPSLVTELVPLVALVAAMLAVLDLAKHRELVVAWAAGLSRAGVVLRVLPAALLVAALKLAIDDRAVPSTVPALRAAGVGEIGRALGPGDAFLWLRLGQDALRLPRDLLTGAASASDIVLLRRDAGGQLVELVRARGLEVREHDWRLVDATRQPVGTRAPTRVAELMLPVALPLDRLRLLAAPPYEVAILDLVRLVAAGGFGVAGVDAQLAALHGRLATATTTGLLVLLGMALAPRFTRGPVTLQVLARGLAIGLAAILVQGVALAVAEDGLVPGWLGAWLAPAALVACLVLLTRGGLAGPATRRPSAGPALTTEGRP